MHSPPKQQQHNGNGNQNPVIGKLRLGASNFADARSNLPITRMSPQDRCHTEHDERRSGAPGLENIVVNIAPLLSLYITGRDSDQELPPEWLLPLPGSTSTPTG